MQASSGAVDDRTPPLRLLYADELGQLKVVQTADGAQLGTAAVAASWGEPDKLQCIDCLDLGSSGGIRDTATAVLAVARCSGGIDLLSPLTGERLGSIPPAAPTSSSGGGGGAGSGSKQQQQQQDAVRVRGLHLLWGSSSSSSGGATLPSVLSVTQGGTARLHTPVAAAAAAAAGEPQAPAGGWEQQRSWQVPAEVCCTAYDPASGRLAVGCQGAELRLFDVATGELVFTFKGGKPNMVGLVDRPWNTAIVFLPPASNSSSSARGGTADTGEGSGSGSGSRLLVGTGYHKVRLYDSEAGKRPQMELTWGESRITCLALEPQGQRCWVGNGLGQIEVLDVAAARFVGAVKGLAGAVRSLAVHPQGSVLASVGLDRYLRLHSVHTRQLLAKAYCKTLPTGVAFCPTDASMLPPLEQKPAEEQKQRRRRRRGAGSDDDAEEEDASSEEEGSEQEQEQKQARQHKRGKPRGEGGSGRKQGSRDRR